MIWLKGNVVSSFDHLCFLNAYFLDCLNQINDKGQLRLSCKALLPDANQEPGSQTSSSVKEKVVYKDDIIKMTTRRSRRKKEVEPPAAENATPKTLENSTADSA